MINDASFEPPVPEPLAERDVVAATASDVFNKIVPDDFHFSRLAIDIDVQTRSAAAAVIGNRNVRPGIHRQRRFRADGNGIAGPKVDERPLESSLFNQQLIAAARSIRPRARAMENDGAVLHVRSL